MINTLIILGVIELLAPSKRAETQKHFPGWEETVEERRDRYESIASDIVAVVDEKGNIPGYDRADSIAMMLAVAHHESGFARDVDLGPCYRGPGWEKRCDSGRAVCLMQIQASPSTNARIQGDRKECLRWGHSAISYSLRTCKENSPETRLAALSGSCKRGHKGAKEIWGMFRRTSGHIRAALEGRKSS